MEIQFSKTILERLLFTLYYKINYRTNQLNLERIHGLVHFAIELCWPVNEWLDTFLPIPVKNPTNVICVILVLHKNATCWLIWMFILKRNHLPVNIVPNLLREKITWKLMLEIDTCNLSIPCLDSFIISTKMFSFQLAPIKLGSQQFACPICSKTMKSAAQIRRHVRSHTGEKPYSCSFCTFAATTKGNLNQHIRSMHSETYWKYRWFFQID